DYENDRPGHICYQYFKRGSFESKSSICTGTYVTEAITGIMGAWRQATRTRFFIDTKAHPIRMRPWTRVSALNTMPAFCQIFRLWATEELRYLPSWTVCI